MLTLYAICRYTYQGFFGSELVIIGCLIRYGIRGELDTAIRMAGTTLIIVGILFELAIYYMTLRI